MKKIMMTAVALLAACGPMLAEDVDPYGGLWASTGCGEGVQCRLEIEKTGSKTYDLRFVAADRMYANVVRCEAKIAMKRGPLSFTSREQYADALAGSYKTDDLVFVVPGVNGSYLNFYVNAAKCGGIDMMGEYVATGDE